MAGDMPLVHLLTTWIHAGTWVPGASHLIDLANVEIVLGMVEAARSHLAEGLSLGQELNLRVECQIAVGRA
jgi:hypothetical protein